MPRRRPSLHVAKKSLWPNTAPGVLGDSPFFRSLDLENTPRCGWRVTLGKENDSRFRGIIKDHDSFSLSAPIHEAIHLPVPYSRGSNSEEISRNHRFLTLKPRLDVMTAQMWRKCSFDKLSDRLFGKLSDRLSDR